MQKSEKSYVNVVHRPFTSTAVQHFAGMVCYELYSLVYTVYVYCAYDIVFWRTLYILSQL